MVEKEVTQQLRLQILQMPPNNRQQRPADKPTKTTSSEKANSGTTSDRAAAVEVEAKPETTAKPEVATKPETKLASESRTNANVY